MEKKYLKDVGKYYIVLISVGGGAIIFSRVVGVETMCVFNSRFKIPCPACGMTSAFLFVFTGNIKEAFYSHPLFFVIPILPFILATNNNKLLYTTGGVFIGVWIIRLITTYPVFY